MLLLLSRARMAVICVFEGKHGGRGASADIGVGSVEE